MNSEINKNKEQNNVVAQPQLAYDDNINYYVKSLTNRMLGGMEVLNELIEPVHIKLNETAFINYIINYYKNPTDENKIKVFELLKNQYRAEIHVYDDNDLNKLLFKMPSIFCNIESIEFSYKDFNSLSSIERLVHEARKIRERAGIQGDYFLIENFKKIPMITDEEKTNLEILKILHRYGVVNLDENKEEANVETKAENNGEVKEETGYIDEW